MENELKNMVHEIKMDLAGESDRVRKMIETRHVDFMHGLIERLLNDSANQAFYYMVNHRLNAVPAIGPRYRYLLPDGSVFVEVQWGVTHPEIQAEIVEAEKFID